MDGFWQVTVDDVVLAVTDWDDIVSTLSPLGIDVVREFEPDFTSFENTSGNLYRLRFEPLDATPATISSFNINPTVAVDELNVVTFCLAGAT